MTQVIFLPSWDLLPQCGIKLQIQLFGEIISAPIPALVKSPCSSWMAPWGRTPGIFRSGLDGRGGVAVSVSTIAVVAAVVVFASVSGLIAGWIDRPTWFTGSAAASLFIVSVAALVILTLDQVGAFKHPASQPAAPAPSSIQSSVAPTAASVSAVAPSTPAASSASPSDQSVSPAGKPQNVSVSLADLCSNGDNHFEGCGIQATQKIGQSNYEFSTDAQVFSYNSSQLSFTSTTCRNLSLRFAIGGDDEMPSDLRITVTVVSQGSRSAVVKPDQLGTLETNLSGGPFEIDVSASMPDLSNGSGWELLMNGSASCSTESGS
jgi:hypothetical protein